MQMGEQCEQGSKTPESDMRTAEQCRQGIKDTESDMRTAEQCRQGIKDTESDKRTAEQCGQGIKDTDQHHSCAEDPQTIDEYIAMQPEEVRLLLAQTRKAIRAGAPDASERIVWRMPTFWQGENLIHFAACKKHLGVYPGDLTTTPFASELADYHTTRGAIQFPYDKPIPFDLITGITAFRVSVAKERHSQKQRKGKKNKVDR